MAKHSIDTLQNSKLRGELAEMAFMYRASSEGIAVAKPYGDSHPYDFLVQHKSRMFRVQVKSTFSQPHGRTCGYQIIVSRGSGKNERRYTLCDVDVVAAFIAPLDLWYVIPVAQLGRRRAIFLYPSGTKMPFGGIYEKYLDAWNLLKDENPLPDPSNLLANESASSCTHGSTIPPPLSS